MTCITQPFGDLEPGNANYTINEEDPMRPSLSNQWQRRFWKNERVLNKWEYFDQNWMIDLWNNLGLQTENKHR